MLGTGSTQSLSILNEGQFYLRVDVTSGGVTSSDTLAVSALGAIDGGGDCPPPQLRCE